MNTSDENHRVDFYCARLRMPNQLIRGRIVAAAAGPSVTSAVPVDSAAAVRFLLEAPLICLDTEQFFKSCS